MGKILPIILKMRDTNGTIQFIRITWIPELHLFLISQNIRENDMQEAVSLRTATNGSEGVSSLMETILCF